jgi:acetyltransferase
MGFRKRKPVDLEQLKSLLVNLSHLSLDHPEIQEIDFNPIIANGRRINIVDAKFLRKVNF